MLEEEEGGRCKSRLEESGRGCDHVLALGRVGAVLYGFVLNIFYRTLS